MYPRYHSYCTAKRCRSVHRPSTAVLCNGRNPSRSSRAAPEWYRPPPSQGAFTKRTPLWEPLRGFFSVVAFNGKTISPGGGIVKWETGAKPPEIAGRQPCHLILPYSPEVRQKNLSVLRGRSAGVTFCANRKSPKNRTGDNPLCTP